MPIFDLDNAVQQGLNRDYSNNDWNVEARNLEIVLEDNAGSGEFRIHDSDNVAVVVANSDGYLSVNGTAEVHGGNLLVEHRTGTNIELITLKDSADQVGMFIFDANPDGVISAEKASIGQDYSDGYLWINRDGATDWDRVVFRYEIDTAINNEIDTVTLQRAYDNDPDGGNATIVTNATDGAIIIAGDQKLQVTATGGIDLDTGFDMDGAGPFDVDITGAVSIDSDAASNFTVAGANLTLETTTSGDVLINVPAAGAGDMVVSDGTYDYIKTDTADREVQLGDTTGPQVITRVLDDLIVDGDLTVNGTETVINTEDLFVEDNMIRININAAPTFNGVTGVEAEVGSDGYVEWHWDDSQTRWEISIDRNTTPGSQTFRPLPYLADAAATLDLSSTGQGGYPTAGPNPTAGASVINTNATNFPYTFGPDMTDNSVQAALEAIDGYFIEVREDAIQSVTLQVAYDNDPDGGNATITTNATDGAVVIAGDQKLQVTATSGIDLDAGFDMDTTSNFDVLLTGSGAFSLDSSAASNATVDGANLTLSTTTSGDVVVSAATNVDVDGTDITLDASSGISLDASAASNFTVDGANLTLSTTTSGDVVVNATTDVDVDGTNITLDASSALSLDAGAASNFTTSAGAITVDGAGGIILEGNGNDVIPGTSCQDSLGDSTHGWSNIYLCDGSNNVIALSAVGTSSTPNVTSGAYLIGTDADNYLATFGGDMTSDTVQSALEAIDGYLQELTVGFSTVTLQIAYKNDADGGDAIITTDATDGAVVIAGTEKFQVTATGGFDLDTGFDMDGAGSFDVDITGAVSIDADAYSNFLVQDAGLVVGTVGDTGTLDLIGQSGIVLDGTGNNVIPADSCTDSLGDSTHGWSTIYLCNGNNVPVSIGSAGAVGTPNTTSGAYIVGTDADNFSTYGSDMTSDTVQAALEAIDGYFVTIRDAAIQAVTLQVAYDNDADGGDATITTNATDGALVIAGDQKLQVTATGGFDLDTGFDMDGAGSFDVDITGAVSIDADAYSNFLVQDAGLVVGTVGDTGTLDLIGQSGIVLDGTGNNVIPADSCTDSLGDSTHGWSTIYLCNGNNVPVSIGSAGTAGTPNTTSGAYVVGTDADNYATYGSYMTSDTVQSALEAIDGYLQALSLEALDTTYTKEIGLDINGGIVNGNVKSLNVSGTAALDYRFSKLSRTQWTTPVPSDWDGVSDIVVEVIWSPDSTNTGNVEWRLEYKSLSLTELASTAATTDDYAQAGGGTANAIQTTGANLSISAGDISTTDEIIVINIVRRGNLPDSFTGDAQVHLVKLVYTAQNIV